MTTSRIPSTSTGGILFPLEPFRPSLLASALAQALVAKARNILDAQLRLTRHPSLPLVVATIEGSVIGGDPGGFWRENLELGIYASTVLPRQCFLYFRADQPQRREGLLIAQRGQSLGGDEADADSMPPNAPEQEWPIARLCAQIRLDPVSLLEGFSPGPTVTLSLAEPGADHTPVLMALAGQDPADPLDADLGDDPGASPEPSGPPARPHRPAIDDAKRRAARLAEQERARAELASRSAASLAYALDEHGAIVSLPNGLDDDDILRPYLVRAVSGELPDGLPGDLRAGLVGKRIDFAVKVELFSEVTLDGAPLHRGAFEAAAWAVELDGHAARALEVRAPRLGPGMLLELPSGLRCFVSRTRELPIPWAALAPLVDPG